MSLYFATTKGRLPSKLVKARAALIHIQTARGALGVGERQHTLVTLLLVVPILPCWGF